MSDKIRVFVELEFELGDDTSPRAAILSLEKALEADQDNPLIDNAEYEIRGWDWIWPDYGSNI